MKTKGIAVLCLTLICSLLVCAKEKPINSEKVMPAQKKAWEIVVKNNLSADDNFGSMTFCMGNKVTKHKT